MAIASGNTRKAAELLRRHSLDVPRSTLLTWQTKYAERYEQIKADVMPAIYEQIAERSEQIADSLGEVEQQLAEQMREQAPDLSPRDTAGALRNVSVARGIAIDKALLTRGRPTSIQAHGDVTEILKGLSERYPNVIQIENDGAGEGLAIEEATETEQDARAHGAARGSRD